MARICVLWLAVVEIHARSWLMSRGELELEILCIEGWYEGGRGVVPLTKTTCPEPSLCYFLPPLFCFPLLLLLTLPLSYSLLFSSSLASNWLVTQTGPRSFCNRDLPLGWPVCPNRHRLRVCRPDPGGVRQQSVVAAVRSVRTRIWVGDMFGIAKLP
jgi:hypothetical protein